MLRDILNLLRKDNLQERALAACHEMLDLCSTMIDASIESLRQKDDAESEIDVAAVDKKINAFERDVRRKVMTHLSLGNEGDLTAGLTLISIVIDIERVGDYAKNIHDIAVHHPRRLAAGPLEEDLQAIEKEALALFHGATHAFKESDEEAARGLMRDYKDEVVHPLPPVGRGARQRHRRTRVRGCRLPRALHALPQAHRRALPQPGKQRRQSPRPDRLQRVARRPDAVAP